MSSLPNEISFDITNFLPNDDITDLMLLSKKFNALVTPRLKKIDQEMATTNQSIESFMPSPEPHYTDNVWITQLNFKRFLPIGSVAKKQMKELFASRQEFDECFRKLDVHLELDVGTFDRLKKRMSLERFDDATFLRVFGAMIAIPKFLQEYNSRAQYIIQMTKQPILVLYYDNLRDIFTFVDRRNLCKLRLVNCCYHDVIDKEFATTPYFLPRLQYYMCNWQWRYDHSSTSSLPPEVREQIFAAKFVKFEHIKLICDSNLKPTDLVPMSQLWEFGELNISWKKDSLPTPEIACLFGKCKYFLATAGNGSVSLLADLLSNGSPSIKITDDIYNPAKTNVPWQAIIDYLYIFNEDREIKKCLHITTGQMANRKDCIQFIDAMKTRFQATANRLSFCFVWHSANKNEELLEQFSIWNSKQHLCLFNETPEFRLSTM